MQTHFIHRKQEFTHYSRWLTLLRIVTGLVLIAKAISFFHDSSTIQHMMANNGWGIFENNTQTIAVIITYVTLLGGVLIATGLFTRWMSIIQIPILTGAVILNISNNSAELILSAIILVLLILFAVKGSGPISADEFFRNYTYAGRERGHTRNFFR
ncbi:MAG: DoxX family protein [Bacteroidetes bacterium]|nr:DoxX family protein [Bacteroidota bacterium]